MSNQIQKDINFYFGKEELVYKNEALASITINLPKMNVESSGIYYLILKQLAWASISVYELISTTHELTVVLKEEKVKEAFDLLMDMKRHNLK